MSVEKICNNCYFGIKANQNGIPVIMCGQKNANNLVKLIEKKISFFEVCNTVVSYDYTCEDFRLKNLVIV